jgi:hypothetical protein
MDQSRFDRWSQSLASAKGPSRRGVLRSVAGLGIASLVGHDETVAKRHKKHNKHKKPTAPPAVPPSPPVPPPVVCPPTCPVCQTCNASTGTCEVRPDGNALPGQNCQSPRVCCSGTCCEPIHACNAAGGCATCAEVCGPTCGYCFTLADGGTACGGDTLGCTLRSACVRTADCPAGSVCVTAVTNRHFNTTEQQCGVVGSGSCYTMNPCP